MRVGSDGISLVAIVSAPWGVGAAGAGGLCARITNAYNWPIPLIVRFRTMVGRLPPDRLPNRAFNARRLARDLPPQSLLFTMDGGWTSRLVGPHQSDMWSYSG